MPLTEPVPQLVPPPVPCAQCDEQFTKYVDRYAVGMGFESPRTWDIYDPRWSEIKKNYEEYLALWAVRRYGHDPGI
jgi:hypothetical protein